MPFCFNYVLMHYYQVCHHPSLLQLKSPESQAVAPPPPSSGGAMHAPTPPPPTPPRSASRWRRQSCGGRAPSAASSRSRSKSRSRSRSRSRLRARCETSRARPAVLGGCRCWRQPSATSQPPASAPSPTCAAPAMPWLAVYPPTPPDPPPPSSGGPPHRPHPALPTEGKTTAAAPSCWTATGLGRHRHAAGACGARARDGSA